MSTSKSSTKSKVKKSRKNSAREKPQKITSKKEKENLIGQLGQLVERHGKLRKTFDKGATHFYLENTTFDEFEKSHYVNEVLCPTRLNSVPILIGENFLVDKKDSIIKRENNMTAIRTIHTMRPPKSPILHQSMTPAQSNQKIEMIEQKRNEHNLLWNNLRKLQKNKM
jgi:hypothetical protein